MRQAMRELLKAYANGLDSRALDGCVRTAGLETWASASSAPKSPPPPLFHAYKLIKQMEKQGKERAEINQLLKEHFSDRKGSHTLPPHPGTC